MMILMRGQRPRHQAMIQRQAQALEQRLTTTRRFSGGWLVLLCAVALLFHNVLISVQQIGGGGSSRELLLMIRGVERYYEQLLSGDDSTIEPVFRNMNNNKYTNTDDDQFYYQTSTDCWIAWDRQRQRGMDDWFEREVPVLITAVDGVHKNQKVPIVNPTLTHSFLLASPWRHNAPDFTRTEWTCLYQTNEPEDEAIIQQTKPANIAPLHWNKRKRGSNVVVFCEAHWRNASSDHDGVLEADHEEDPPNSSGYTLYGIQPAVPSNPSNFQQYYDIRLPLECGRLESQELDIQHGADKFLPQSLGSSPGVSKNQPRAIQSTSNGVGDDDDDTQDDSTSLKVGACLMFKGDRDRQRIPEWIEYHRLIGVNHFWIYMNEPFNMTGLYNRSYVSYIPFDISWNNHDPQYMRKYFNRSKEIQLIQIPLSQDSAQTSCLYTAKKYQLDWFVTTDVVEYIRVPKQPFTNTTSNHPSRQPSVPPLQAFLSRFPKDKFGCMAMNSILYGRNTFLTGEGNLPNEYMIDHVWRMNRNLSDYKMGRYKQFYNADGVWSLGCHYCFSVDDGLRTINLPAQKGVYMHHFKGADKGVLKNADANRYCSRSELLQDTFLIDNYRGELDQAMEHLKQDHSTAGREIARTS